MKTIYGYIAVWIVRALLGIEELMGLGFILEAFVLNEGLVPIALGVLLLILAVSASIILRGFTNGLVELYHKELLGLVKIED